MNIYKRDKIRKLRDGGHSIREITKILGYKSPRTIAYWLDKDKYLSSKVCDKTIAFEHIHRIVHEETNLPYNLSDNLTYKILKLLGYK